jgi:transposase
MKKQLFIGIDVSKETLDVSFIFNFPTEEMAHEVFRNDKKGFKSILKWLKKSCELSLSEYIVCMEHTGTYTLELCCFLEEHNIRKCLENSPLLVL